MVTMFNGSDKGFVLVVLAHIEQTLMHLTPVFADAGGVAYKSEIPAIPADSSCTKRRRRR